MDTKTIKHRVQFLRLPFFTSLLSYEFLSKEETLNVSIIIDTERHIFLKSHVFGGNCLMPATGMIELITESSILFLDHLKFKNRYITGLENFVIERAMPFKIGSKEEIKIVIQNLSTKNENSKIQVTICSDAKNSKGKVVRRNRRHCFANVILSRQPLPVELAQLPLQEDAKHFNMTKEFTYKTCYPTHGKLFQTLNGKFTLFNQDKDLIGQFDMNSLEEQFIENNNSAFITSPLAYDSALQLQVFTATLSTKTGRLPIGGKKLKFYQKPDTQGIQYVIVERVKQDDITTTSNIYILNHNKEKIAEFLEFTLQKQVAWQLYNSSQLDRIFSEFQVKNLDY